MAKPKSSSTVADLNRPPATPAQQLVRGNDDFVPESEERHAVSGQLLSEPPDPVKYPIPDDEPAAAAPPAPAKPVEPKDQKFVRLANRRVNQALNRLKAVQNLANKVQYEYTEEQARRVCKVLSDAVADIADAFTASGKPKGGGFTV